MGRPVDFSAYTPMAADAETMLIARLVTIAKPTMRQALRRALKGLLSAPPLQQTRTELPIRRRRDVLIESARLVHR